MVSANRDVLFVCVCVINVAHTLDREGGAREEERERRREEGGRREGEEGGRREGGGRREKSGGREKRGRG